MIVGRYHLTGQRGRVRRLVALGRIARVQCHTRRPAVEVATLAKPRSLLELAVALHDPSWGTRPTRWGWWPWLSAIGWPGSLISFRTVDQLHPRAALPMSVVWFDEPGFD